jgi:crossover junction endodeoxyribonuclease RuvC
MIIIGIDPGTATTGYGVIEVLGNTKKQIKMMAYGCIQTKPSSVMGDRLNIIHKELSVLIKTHGPEIMAVESLYFFRNLKTALPVSQAKGVILFTAAKNKIPVYEFTPLQVKFTITGYGKAEKEKVQEEIKKILRLKEIPKPDDAADALGVAICGALKIYSAIL